MNGLISAVLPTEDLLRDRTYRRLWTSILISSFGGQLTLLAVPLTAAPLLRDFGMAVFLATPESDYIVAQTYNVDGGQWMS